MTPSASRRIPPHHVFRHAFFALVLLVSFLAASPVRAQEDCFHSWTRPVVCQLRVEARDHEGRWRRVDARHRLRIPAGDSVELRVKARDQEGWRFPEDRLRIGIDLDRDCRDLVRLERDPRGGRYRLVAGAERGRCQAIVWVPGNMNLDTAVRLEVVSRARAGYTHAQARTIARRLYLGILGREPDPEGWNAATLEIQRGRLDQQIRGMIRSGEFRSIQRRLSPSAFLRQLYHGLLGREPDSQGVRTYLHKLERGKTDEVVRDLVRSEEFERKLLATRRTQSGLDTRRGR